MKLLIYSHFFAPSTGGVETIVMSLALGLASFRSPAGDAQFDVTVATNTPAGAFDDSALPFQMIRQPSLGRLWGLVRACDVVHMAGPALLPLMLARVAGKPVVLEHHGFQCICPNGQLFIEKSATPCPGHFMAGHHAVCIRCNSDAGWLTSVRLWLLTFARRFFAARASANVTPTQWLGAMLQLPAMQHVAHGLRTTARYSRSVMPGRIVFQGRLVTTKGCKLLLDAVELLHDEIRPFELVVIGDGPERAVLEKQVAESKLQEQVRFTGHIEPGQLEEEIASAAVVVVPSLGGEVFGLVVVENMLRGVPVVASNLGAFVEVMGGAGKNFRTGSAVDLAGRLAEFLADPSDAESCGQRGRQRVLDFYDRHRMMEGHIKVYQRVIDITKN
jgi:glycogen(starch) synthase